MLFFALSYAESILKKMVIILKPKYHYFCLIDTSAGVAIFITLYLLLRYKCVTNIRLKSIRKYSIFTVEIIKNIN